MWGMTRLEDPAPDIAAALEALERKVGLRPPFGASKLPPHLRYQAVLGLIRARICPALEKRLPVLGGVEGDLATIIADALLVAFAGAAIPVVTIAHRIAQIGIKRFCARPELLLEDPDKPS